VSPPQLHFIDLSTRKSPAAESAFLSTELVDRSAPGAALYRASANAVGLHPLPHPVAIDAEAARWQAFLDDLASRVATGAVPAAQRAALLTIWRRALSRQPTLRRPAVGFSSDGTLEVSWAFSDSPGQTFTLEILRDGTCEWFFRDTTAVHSDGTADAPDRELPPRAIELLATNFASISVR
jgi:hypothetical protein